MRLAPLLAARNLYTDQVRTWLHANVCRTTDDLAYAFKDNSQLLEIAPFLAEAWVVAAAHCSSDTELVARVRAMNSDFYKSKAACRPLSPPKPAKRKKKPYRPRTTGPKDVKGEDRRRREKAAEEAVRHSLSMAPQRGVARGMPAGDPLINVIRETQVLKVAQFEPNGVRNAVKESQRYELWLQEKTQGRVCPETGHQALLETYLYDGEASTSAVAAWNRLSFMDKYLATGYNTSSVAKPRPQAGKEDGQVKAVEQAIAAPPEFYIRLEICLGKLIADNDWRRVAVAATLCEAYGMIRPTHQQRTKMTHKTKTVYWCEAFRGKGKRAGARRAFKYCLPRFGVTGIDIAGSFVMHGTTGPEKPASPWSTRLLTPTTALR